MAGGKLLTRSGFQNAYEVHVVHAVAADFTGNSEVDLGYDLPGKGVVVASYVDVKTAEATATTKTLDVGLLSSESGGDADGFLDGISVAATGIVKGTLASAGQTLGALLRVDETGSSGFVPEGHVLNGTAKSVCATFGDSDGANELEADIYFLVFRPLR